MNATNRRVAAAVLVVLVSAATAAADFDVRVEVKNTSDQVKTDWPVVLRVYTVLGRNLPPGGIARDGFRVLDPSGKEVPHAVGIVPPADQVGNDELVFVISRAEPGQTLSYRVTNAPDAKGKTAKIDLVASPHNLLADGGAETPDKPVLTGAVADDAVAHSGKRSFKLAADGKTVSAKSAKPIALRKGAWYYFSAWSKTQRVARFGYQASGGASIAFTAAGPDGKPTAAFAGSIPPQCSTRDWLKMAFEGPVTDWGNDRYVAQATADSATMELTLRQPKHYYMKPGATDGTWWLDDMVLMEQPEVTVRFDESVKPLVQDGAMLFTRPPHTYLGLLDDKGDTSKEWCSYPYAHEKLTKLDKSAFRGQRVSYVVGIYHTRPIADVTAAPSPLRKQGVDDNPRLPAGAIAEVPVEIIEYLPGFVGEGRDRYLQVLGEGGQAKPVTLAGDVGVRYFLVTYRVPADAPPGRYEGKIEVRFGDKLRQSVPAALRVQPLVQKAPTDVFVGMIYQGGDPPFNDEGLGVYARSGFNSITRFGGFLSFEKTADGASQVDLARLDKTMQQMKGLGLVGVCVFTDFDLGPKWDGGNLLKRVRPAAFKEGNKSWEDRLETAGDAWKAQISRIEGARKEHPDWPELIYMTWDEPSLGGGTNGKPAAAMRWVNEVAPKALTTLDVQFDPLPVCLKWYNTPAFDDPATWAGPEVYGWIADQGKGFGFCGSAREEGDSCRYQAGMLMIASGARYFHAWHLSRPQKMAANMSYSRAAGRTLRTVGMVSYGAGMDDLKAWHMLRTAIAAAEKSGDPARKKLAAEAKAYLAGVAKVFNGDHKFTWPNEPYLGTSTDWGCAGFYDQWQQRMARYAVELSGQKWVE